MKYIVMGLFLLLSLVVGETAEAKWWIFGQSENEISTRYLYLNGVSYDELGDKVTIYRETLPEGRLVLRGKAGTTSSKIGVIQVSRDGKATWEEAGRSDDGTFEYGFVPEAGKTYVMHVKIMDTTGKANDVEATRKELTISNQNISAAIRTVLDAMITAYRTEDPRRFMTHVSSDFVADPAVLDRAVRSDFSLFDNIDLRYTLNNVTAGRGGKVFTALSFSRTLTSSKSGKTLSDKGATEFVFTLEEAALRVFSMKSPLIFGLSDAENVATGTVPQADPVITVAGDGTVSVGSPSTGGGGGSGSGIPAPQALTANGTKHHFVDLTFNSSIDQFAAQGVYEVVAEEALSPNGPWSEAERKAFDTFIRVMTDTIAQQAALIYFRVKIVKIAGGAASPWSNVVTWDNR